MRNNSKSFKHILAALLTIAALAAGHTTAWAQDIDYTATVGTGTSSYHLIPIATNYKYSLTQQIYTAEDIMRAGTIRTISFYAYKKFDKDLGTIKVYLKQIGKSSFDNKSDIVAIGDGDKVFEGSFYPNAAGWTTITLDTPFAYDGYSNLLVCLYDGTAGANHYPSTDYKFRYSTTSDKMTISWRSDSSAPDLNNLSSFTENNNKDIYSYRSNIQIGFSNSSTVSILPKPSDLNSAIVPGDGTSAVVSWVENGSATAWQICLNEDTEHPIDAPTNPYTITGLTADAACSVRVRAVTSGDHSSWSDAINFTPTAVSDYTLTINKSTATKEDVPVYGINIDEGTSLCQFIIPASTLSLMSNSTLEKMTFYSGTSYQNVSWGDARFKVYMTEVGATAFSSTSFYDWEPLDEVDLGNLSVVNGKMEITFDTPYQYHGGNLLVGVRQIVAGTQASCFWKVKTVGNNTVNRQNTLHQSQPETTFQYSPGFSGSYPKPADVSVSYTEGTTAGVSWTSSASAWQIRLNDDKANLINVPTNPFNLTGLDYITEYHVQVRADYGSGHYSHWSPTTSFSTIGACPQPTNLESTLTPGSGTTATLSWTENGTATTWQVCLNGDTGNLINVSTNPYTLTGLTPDVATTVKIRAFNGGPSYWSNSISITPESISSLAVDYTGGSSAEVSWISNDVTAWDISMNGGVLENITANPYTLTGLSSGTTYEVKVRTRSGNDVGAWSNVISFKAYDIQNVNYIDADGYEQSVTAAVLSGSETTLDDGWYVVGTDISFDHRINVNNAHARIILADGATMQIGTSEMHLNNECIGYVGSNVNSQLSIYGQSGGTGSLSVYSTSIAIDVPTVNIYGGNVIASGGVNNLGIRSENCFSISGGTVSATGGIGGIHAYGITLGWKNASDRIYASSYSYSDGGSLTIADGQYLYTGTEVVSGTVTDLTKVNDKTLQPAVKITLGTGITATGAGVIIQADGTYALPGATVTLGHGDRDGYSFDDGSYTAKDSDDGYITITEDAGVYTFEMPTKDVTVTATWTANAELDITSISATLFGEEQYVTTFYNGTLDYRLPEGAKAYTASLDGTNVVFHLIGEDGRVIPKNTAAIVVANADNLTLTKLASTEVTAHAGNILRGSDTAVTVTAGKVDGKTPYVLGIDNSTLGFYKFSGDTIPAGKAFYLKNE